MVQLRFLVKQIVLHTKSCEHEEGASGICQMFWTLQGTITQTLF